MHLLNTLSVVDNPDTEWLHNVIANIFEVALKDAPVLPTHITPQLEPKLLLKVDALVQYQICTTVISNSVPLIPNPEVLYIQLFQIDEVPLVSCEILFRLLALQHNRLVFLKRIPSQDALRVGNHLIHIHRRGDLKVLKHSASYVAHSADHCGSLMIEHIDVGELPLH